MIRKIYISMTVLMFLIVFSIVSYSLNKNIIEGDADFLWHIKQGDWMLENHKIYIDNEIFSSMFDFREWPYLSLISDIILSLLYKIGGFAGIVIQTAFIIALTYSTIFYYMTKKGHNKLLMFATIIMLIPFVQYHWLPRPVIYSYFFIVVWYILLEKFYMNKIKYLVYILIPLQILWTNIHSTFIYGYVFVTFFLLSASIEAIVSRKKEKIYKALSFLGIFIFTGLVSLINPFGVNYYKNLFLNQETKKISEILTADTFEYMSPDFHNEPLWNVLMFVIVFILIKNKSKFRIYEIVSIIFWIFSAFEYRRHIPILGIVLMLTLPKMIESFYIKKGLKEWTLFRGILQKISFVEILETKKNIVIQILLILMIFIILNQKYRIINPVLDGRMYPRKAIEYLKSNNITENIFNYYNFGAFMIWDMYPKRTTFIDARASIFPYEIVYDYRYIARDAGPEMYKKMNKYNIKWVFVRKDSYLASVLRYNKYFEVKYIDDSTVIFYWREEGRKKLESSFSKERYIH